MKKRIIALTLLFVLLSTAMLFAGGSKEEPIYILYTNDIHCGYNKNITFPAVAEYKQSLEAESPYVTLIDNGDAIQGETVGTVSRGEYLIEMMNAAGYDFGIFGNHEFDYGMDRLAELIELADFQYLNATITYSGAGTNLLANTKPYEIVEYGSTKVAFIGVATHETLVKSTPKYFMEDGEFVYDFATGEGLYELVQSYVDEVRKKGADYVVILSHLGIEEGSEPDRSVDLIAHLTDVDVLLDGHSHSVVEAQFVKDAEGKPVLYSQTGTKLANLGQLTIYPKSHKIMTEFVHPTEEDADVAAVVAAIDAEYLEEVMKVVAKSEITLSIKDPVSGARVVRNREAAIGDLCADAYRAVTGAEIAFVNGGGIRADLKAGDITLDSIIKIHPYGNMLCMCEATGQEIVDALEWASRNTLAKQNDGGNASGENGGFLQVSGLKYTIDTRVNSTCIKDADGLFAGVAGARRVKDVMVGSEETGWEPIDLNKTYTLACHNYLLQDMGDGFTMFADNNYLIDNAMLDNQVLITYITDYLNGEIKAADYGAVKGRITVK
ncbi:MAG: bifunctional metallophosphatase/5'-nucleotidase [Sphaerochaetaceae bacterium]|nr:bifunctional metallophosphatase/5'-nucleotidase [Sphaerochaetaceae bacterium]